MLIILMVGLDKEETELDNILEKTNHGFILSNWFGNQYRKNEYIDKFWNKYKILKKRAFLSRRGKRLK